MIGIFGHLHDEDEEGMLMLLLVELLESLERSRGGSVHQNLPLAGHSKETKHRQTTLC